ncbi:hypothetical protein [Streptosporangium fragile]
MTVTAGNRMTWFVGRQGDLAVAALPKNCNASAITGSFFSGFRTYS